MAMKELDYDYCHTAPGIYRYVLLVVYRLFNRAGKGTSFFRFGSQYEELALITSFSIESSDELTPRKALSLSVEVVLFESLRGTEYSICVFG